MLRRLGIVLLTLLPLVYTGCMGGDEDAQVSKDDLGSLVLQREDLPPLFTRFDSGELAVTDIRPGPRAEQSRFGRVAGWKARYRRSGSAQASGPLVVESRVDLFRNNGGAAQDLAAYREELAQTVDGFKGPARSLDPPGVGEGSAAITLTQRGGQVSVRLFTIAWRRAELTASISVNGFEGRVVLGDALALARKQDRRIAEALER